MVLSVEDWALFLVLLQDLGGDLVAEAAEIALGGIVIELSWAGCV